MVPSLEASVTGAVIVSKRATTGLSSGSVRMAPDSTESHIVERILALSAASAGSMAIRGRARRTWPSGIALRAPRLPGSSIGPDIRMLCINYQSFYSAHCPPELICSTDLPRKSKSPVLTRLTVLTPLISQDNYSAVTRLINASAAGVAE